MRLQGLDCIHIKACFCVHAFTYVKALLLESDEMNSSLCLSVKALLSPFLSEPKFYVSPLSFNPHHLYQIPDITNDFPYFCKTSLLVNFDSVWDAEYVEFIYLTGEIVS